MATAPGMDPAPPHGFRRRGGAGLSPRVVALLALLVSGLLAIVAERWYVGVRRELVAESVRNEIVPTANGLESALATRLLLLRGLSAHLEITWDRPDRDALFDRFAEDVLRNVPSVLGVQYVDRDGTIAHVFPREGNEAALGRNLLRDPRPETVADFRRALMESGVVVSGPTELYQGGIGLIGRLGARDPRGEILAVVAVVMRLDPVLAEAGLLPLPSVHGALLDERGALITGDSLLLGEPAPISAAVRIADRRWTLSAVPAGGWAATLAERTIPMRAALLALVLLAVGLAYGLAGRRDARSEAARLRGEEKFARLFGLTPDGVAFTRLADGVVLDVNESFVQMTGRSRQEMLGRSTVALGLWPTPADREAMVEAITRSGTINDYAVALARPDGSVRETRLAGRVIKVEGEACVLMIIRDVTEQRKLERRLAEAARLESIGRLAGGIAHDFNNLVTAISGYAHLLVTRLADRPSERHDAEEVVQAAARAADLTAQLLAFARRQVVQPRTVDVNAMILAANRRLRVVLGESVTLSIRLSPEPLFIRLDPTQADQLLMNLVVNARDAMPDGGTVVLQAERQEERVVVSVRDSGVGIPLDVQARIFDPFFTTKPTGQGTGLGLATCYGIMEQAGGRIEVDSAPGQGATFRLIFPAAPPEEAESGPGATISATRGGETVLVVEDEAQVRKLVERVLTQLGYEVLGAASGPEALALDATHEGPVHLLLTDMVMPGMGGGELSRRVRERHPAIKVLLMSGYSEELVAAEHGDVPFLPKPFTPAELTAKVREVLGG